MHELFDCIFYFNSYVELLFEVSYCVDFRLIIMETKVWNDRWPERGIVRRDEEES